MGCLGLFAGGIAMANELKVTFRSAIPCGVPSDVAADRLSQLGSRRGAGELTMTGLLRGGRRAFGRVVMAEHEYDSHGNDAERRQQQQPPGGAGRVGLYHSPRQQTG